MDLKISEKAKQSGVSDAARRLVLLLLIALSPLARVEITPFPYAELAYLIIYLYLLASAPLVLFGLRRGILRRYVAPIFGLLLLLAASSFLQPNPTAENWHSVLRNSVFFALMFSLAAHDFSNDDSLRRWAPRALLVAAVIAASGLLFGLAVELGLTGRLTVFGSNPNTIGLIVAGGAVVCFSLFLRSIERISRRGFVPLLAYGLLLAMLVAGLFPTGSRTALVAVFTSFAVVAVFSSNRLNAGRLAAIAATASFALLLTLAAKSSDLLSSRFTQTEDDIRFMLLWPLTWELFMEAPLVGVGLPEVESTLTDAFGRYITPHNDFLRIAAAGGVASLLLFVSFLLALLRDCVRSVRAGSGGLAMGLWVVAVIFLSAGAAIYEIGIWVVLLTLFAATRPIESSN